MRPQDSSGDVEAAGHDTSAASIASRLDRLRIQAIPWLSACSTETITSAMAHLAHRWSDPDHGPRRAALASLGALDARAAAQALDALLPGFRQHALATLLHEQVVDPSLMEGFRSRPLGGRTRAMGAGVAGLVLAGNTPLLSWPLIASALLARCPVFVKMSRADTVWPAAFCRELSDLCPDLGRCLDLDVWRGGAEPLDAALAAGCDTLIVTGGAAAVAAWRSRASGNSRVHSYGHRISFALIGQGSDSALAAAGLADDILAYGLDGCLSPQITMVEGDRSRAWDFGDALSCRLRAICAPLPVETPTADRALRARTAREMAALDSKCEVWADPHLRWTVVLASSTDPPLPCGAGVAFILPVDGMETVEALLSPYRRQLQAVALAASQPDVYVDRLARLGVSRICAPGRLQRPPLHWHEDGRRLIADLVRWVDWE